MIEHKFKKDIIYAKLKERIISGEYSPAFKFPNERQFCKELGVSIITLRAALHRLAKDGLIIRRPANGTFVAPLNNMAQGNNEHIFVAMSDAALLESPLPYILQGIKDAIYKSGKGVILCGIDYISNISGSELNGKLKKKNVSGIICLDNGYNGDEPVISTLGSSGLPVVIPHGQVEDYNHTGFATVTTNYKKGWLDALAYLTKQGHERVASLVLREHNIRGYSLVEHNELLEKYGLSTDASLTEESSYENKDRTKTIVKSWMQSSAPPSAIMCYSDFFAIDVYNALKEIGIKIPEDVAVMGCCGYPGSAFLHPSLTTVDYEYYKSGLIAVETLNKSNEWFHSKNTARPLIVKEHCIIERESTSIKRLEKEIKLRCEQFVL